MYTLIDVIGRGGFGRVLAGTRKFDNLPVRSYQLKSYLHS